MAGLLEQQMFGIAPNPNAPVTGGAPRLPAPGGNVAEPLVQPPTSDIQAAEDVRNRGRFPQFPGVGDAGAAPGGLPQFPQEGGGFEGTGVGELPQDSLPTGAAFRNIPFTGNFSDPTGTKYGTGGLSADTTKPPVNESGKGGAGGTPTLSSQAPGRPGGAGGGGAGGARLTPEQQQLVFQRLWDLLMGQNTAPAYTPAAVPDFRQEAMQQAELMRKRQGLVQANEAAATGGAGSRDLGYRQSLLDEALLNAGGNIGAEQAGRQFQANLQAKTLEAQQNAARFRDVMAMLNSLGQFTRQ